MNLPLLPSAVFLCLAAVSGFAEAPPEIAWAVQAGGAKHDKTRGLTTDAAGNIYMTGEFSQTGSFGEVKVESKGDLDFFVAKYSPEGKCLWVRSGGGAKIDRGYGVAVDAAGNVFATGHCQSTDAAFDAEKMPNRGDYDLFVVSYDASGKLRWLKSGGGPGYDYGHGIKADGQGNVLVTGAFVGTGEIAGAEVANAAGSHAFLAKFSGTGDLLWRRVSSGSGGNAGEHVAVDAAGNAVIVGGSAGITNFEDVTLTVKSGRNPFAVKFDPSGKALWGYTAAGATSGLFASVALDGKGEVSVCGMYQGTLEIGAEKAASNGLHDVVVAKLDAAGKLRWAKLGGGVGTDYALGMAADGAGNSYVTGEFTKEAALAGAELKGVGTRDLYVAKFDDAGALAWVRTAGGVRGSLAYCVALLPAGGLCVSGAFDGEATYGPSKLTSTGANDIFLLKLGR